MSDFSTGGTLATIAIIIAIIVILIIIATGYVKAPPNKAFIISGWRKKPRHLIGQAGIKIPFIERKDELLLESISVDVRTKNSVPTTDFININVDAVANIQVDYDIRHPNGNEHQAGIDKAAKNFLNRDAAYIANFARETLEGNLREIIGEISLSTLVQNRKDVVAKVTDNVTPDLSAMGIKLVSFNIQNFSDENGIIEDLGIENVVTIKQEAAIARAKADKAIAVEEAKADKESNDARIAADLEIEKKNQELKVQKAELKAAADVEIAKADASYKIQEEEERKRIEIATQNADIAKAEKEEELRMQQVKIKEQTLDADIKKTADANRYAEQQKADAEKYSRKAEAEAKRIEQEEMAKGIEAVGRAEGEAIRQKGLAEAEAMQKKAEAYKEYNNAAMAEMLINILPETATAIANQFGSIKDITIYGGGSDNGINGVTDNVPTVLKKTFDTIKSATGIDLAEIAKGESLEAKTTKNVNVTGLGDDITDIIK